MKRILMTLCALAMIVAGAFPAHAAEKAEPGKDSAYYPISVEEYTAGDFDELRIQKVYQLSLDDDPSLIPTEDFTRSGRLYHLLDMTRKDEVGVDMWGIRADAKYPNTTTHIQVRTFRHLPGGLFLPKLYKGELAA